MGLRDKLDNIDVGPNSIAEMPLVMQCDPNRAIRVNLSMACTELAARPYKFLLEVFREGSTTPVCFKFVDCTAMTAPTTVMIPIPETSLSLVNYTVRCCAVECMG